MNIGVINSSIEAHKEQLLQHTLYNRVKSVDDLRVFLETHVYAVWDFMSLLKALQAKLTCVHTPWMPVGNPEMRYLINEIVLAKETDINVDGKRQSHYEMYIEAMEACGADTKAIKAFLEDVVVTQNIFVSIRHSGLHSKVKDFMDFTFRVIEHGGPHEIAAACTFGRENLIPLTFTEVLRNFQGNFPETDLSKLIYYFERHIRLNADEHGPMGMQMIAGLCGEDAQKWNEVKEISHQALEKRAGLWNAIEQNIMEHDMAAI